MALSVVIILRALTLENLADTIVSWIRHIFSLSDNQADMESEAPSLD